MFEPWMISVAGSLLIVAGVFSVMKSSINRLVKDVEILYSKMNLNGTKINNLDVEKSQFLKLNDIDNRFATKESHKSLETLCDKQFHNIIEMIKRLENKIDNQARKID